MTFQPWQVYVLGAVVIVIGLGLGQRGHNVRARDVRGSIVAGKVNGAVTITNSGPDVAPDKGRKDGGGDRVAWIIGIVGVLIAGAQLAHDVFSSAK